MTNHSNNPSNLIISNNIPEIDTIKVNTVVLCNNKDTAMDNNNDLNNDKGNLNTEPGTTCIIKDNKDNSKDNKDLRDNKDNPNTKQSTANNSTQGKKEKSCPQW